MSEPSAAKLDRRITFQENTPTAAAGGSGALTDSWAAFYTCWAEKIPVPASYRDEKYQSSQLVALAFVGFRIRYANDMAARITPKDTCRLIDDTGRTFEIVRVAEVPGARHAWLDIYAFARGE